MDINSNNKFSFNHSQSVRVYSNIKNPIIILSNLTFAACSTVNTISIYNTQTFENENSFTFTSQINGISKLNNENIICCIEEQKIKILSIKDDKLECIYTIVTQNFFFADFTLTVCENKIIISYENNIILWNGISPYNLIKEKTFLVNIKIFNIFVIGKNIIILTVKKKKYFYIINYSTLDIETIINGIQVLSYFLYDKSKAYLGGYDQIWLFNTVSLTTELNICYNCKGIYAITRFSDDYLIFSGEFLVHTFKKDEKYVIKHQIYMFDLKNNQVIQTNISQGEYRKRIVFVLIQKINEREIITMTDNGEIKKWIRE